MYESLPFEATYRTLENLLGAGLIPPAHTPRFTHKLDYKFETKPMRGFLSMHAPWVM